MSIEDENIFCDTFIDKSINNPKDENYLGRYGRFNTILSDPCNLMIKRCQNAGKIINGDLIMHNGIKVIPNGYYGSFSEILKINKGCHEPGEEYLFNRVLEHIKPKGTMIELGSYWSFYSIWFNKVIEEANNYCIEPEDNGLAVGRENSRRNECKIDFTKGYVGGNFENVVNPGEMIDINNFIKQKNIDYIDILHSDIQGNEVSMLQSIKNLLMKKKIKYLIISTHSNSLHYECIKILKSCNYRIIASADFDTETFCFDGIILSCHEDNMELPNISLGNRKHTFIREKCYLE